MHLYGLIGYPLDHSLSKDWFSRRFRENGMQDTDYRNFPLQAIDELPRLMDNGSLEGFNVTSPYKRSVIAFLDYLDKSASEIGAVNCVVRKGKIWKGYNTDWTGFKRSLYEFLDGYPLKALILGSGGAAQAAAYALKALSIPFLTVSRSIHGNGFISYGELTAPVMDEYRLIVNATPLGMFPYDDTLPPIPYELVTPKHYLYDMVYNPPVSEFLRLGQSKGAHTFNGMRMLELQAEESWNIFFGG